MPTSDELWEIWEHYIPDDPRLRFEEEVVWPRTSGVNGATLAGGAELRAAVPTERPERNR